MFVFNWARVRQVPGWVMQGHRYWLIPTACVAILYLVLQPKTPEVMIRLVGFFLQLLGSAAVMLTILDIRRAFGRPSLFKQMMESLRTFPLFKRHHVLKVEAMHLSISTSLIGMTVTPSPGASLERRVELLEKEMKMSRGRLIQVERRIEDEVLKANEKFSQEKFARTEAIEELNARLENLIASGLHVPALGFFLVVVGSVLSTFSPELSMLLAL